MPGTDAFTPADLRLLDEVVRTGSFTAAARAGGYTQSAVSRRVAALEQAAGGPLFERRARGVRLTPAGRLLHDHATALLTRLGRARDELRALHAGTGGTLRVGAFATANVALVPQAVRDFAARRPDVRVQVREDRTPRLVADLDAGDLDVAVVSDYPSGPPAGAGRLQRLRTDELLVALPAAHPLADADVVDLRDLAEEDWIEAAPRGQPTALVTAAAAAGFTPRTGLRVAEWTGKFGFVAAGLGVTLVPGLAAAAVPPGVVLRRLRDPAPRRTVYASLPATPLPAARDFVDLLR